MIQELDRLIKESMLKHDSDRVKVLRSIKSEVLLYQTSKNSKPLDEAAWISIILKMIKQREDSKLQYIKAGRLDLADIESKEISILNEFLPIPASKEDIENTIKEIMSENGWENNIPKKSMGVVVKSAKEKLLNVDSKELVDYIKTLCV